jgi:hypothetical protein
MLPALNPYFMMRDGVCTGVWDYEIVAAMDAARPSVSFTGLDETFDDVLCVKDGRMTIKQDHPKKRLDSLKLSNYASLATRMTIH